MTSQRLKRTLGRWDIALLTVGSVIGSGIFLVPGQVAIATMMNALLASAVWIAGAVLSLCGAITYARLAHERPDAGGLYIYIRDGHGRAAAFVFGWVSLLVNIAGTVAALASAAAGVFGPILPSCISVTWVAVGISLSLGILNLLPTRRSGEIQGWTAAAKYFSVLLFAGLLLMRSRSMAPASIVPAASCCQLRSNLIGAVVAVLWAFEGWQYVTCASGEVKDAGRSMGFGLITGVAALALVFLLTSLAVSLWLSPTELSASLNVVQVALQKAGFRHLALLVTAILPVAILSSAHATLLTGSRVIYAMAKDGLMPAALGAVSKHTGIPYLAVIACTLAAALLAALGSFDALLAYVIVTSWLFYGLAGFAIFRIVPRQGKAGWWIRASAVVFCSGSVGVMLFGLISGPSSARYGLVVTMIGWIAGLFWVSTNPPCESQTA